MKIINPLYDNAFKYLMENEQIAKIVLSIILDMQVIRFQSKPQETTLIFTGETHLSRFDFKAVISDENNEEKVILIELQKYRNPDPIIRFRQYLAQNYLKEETIIDKDGNEQKLILPIITIYILGFELKEFDSVAVKSENKLFDIINGKHLDVKSKFVDLLTHPSYFLQAVQKKNKKGTRLERFLSIFLEKFKNEPANYFIDIEEETFEKDAEMKKILDFLNKATQNEDLRRSLEFEKQTKEGYEKYEQELEDTKQEAEDERKLKEQAEKQAEDERKLKEQAEKQAEDERKLKERAEKQAEYAKQEAEDERKLKEQAKKRLLESAKKMKAFGMPIEDILSTTGLTKEEIKDL